MADGNLFTIDWSRFATDVYVVSTIEKYGNVHGMAANGIASVTLNHLLVLDCVGHNRNSYALIKNSGRFCINILTEDQQNVGEYYAKPPEKRTTDTPATVVYTNSGSASLEGSLASMDCQVVNEYVAGDHTVFIAEVDEITLGEGRPLIFFEGKWDSLASS